MLDSIQHWEIVPSAWPFYMLLQYKLICLYSVLKLEKSLLPSPWLVSFGGYFRASIQCLFFIQRSQHILLCFQWQSHSRNIPRNRGVEDEGIGRLKGNKRKEKTEASDRFSGTPSPFYKLLQSPWPQFSHPKNGKFQNYPGQHTI